MNKAVLTLQEIIHKRTAGADVNASNEPMLVFQRPFNNKTNKK